MIVTTRPLSIAILASALGLSSTAQAPPAPALPQAAPTIPAAEPAPASSAVEQLLSFKDSDIKFDLRDLLEILRDRRHEGWVLAAYPDPKTGHPLIGAGVSLDLPAREHPQTDPLNPHPFLEPSSADLWQAAGLDPDRLHTLLDQFDTRLAAWSKRGFRRKIKTLEPQITDDDATRLLRVAAIQAIYNARGYCRDFDQLTASQQMAVSQLVYQMGVNLQHFNQFLDLINNRALAAAPADAALERAGFAANPGYWKSVQQSLAQSQWARLYRMRAVAVIAMLDPKYPDGPGVAEQRVGAMLRPVAAHRRAAKGRSASRSRNGRLRREKKRGV